MIDQPLRQPEADRGSPRDRLAKLVRELAPDAATDKPAADRVSNAEWSNGRAGRLVERWLPGGTRAVDGIRTATGRHRQRTVVIVLVGLLAIIGTCVALWSQRPVAEQAPPLPVAVSSYVPTSPSATASTQIVVSVVGKVLNPGLVNLPNGSRVADAVRAAGGASPGADLSMLNLARRLSDGEQIYVGVPAPPGMAADAPAATDPAATDPGATDSVAPPKKGKGGKKSAAEPTGKVDLNTATADLLMTLPGVGPATAQRIVNWRNQHGQFSSIGQLKDVGGIGPAKFAKLENLVST